ncbi:nitroreductase family deazaflavin-dependent oxidoreductase [Streptomyces sp. WAC07061]|uniref:nitroreductase/quinone reductase family protein n=1 Tax=Streptomyces sp. WAC07061 TaxID=2487410 RepID=UPI000F7B7D59|nr:nitroreductase/quinone reductase family protein [Streptomyces sp. WAC07061]RSS44223.1 nitroreductase family deazaflavin-dependent oxidoreductase [Streptomyces sp. WAC07061]
MPAGHRLPSGRTGLSCGAWRTALAYVRDGEAYVLTASDAGAGSHPARYLNLTPDPAVTLQVGTRTFPATARRATPAEAERLWPEVVAAMPSYAAYRASAGREIPLVLVTPAEGAGGGEG